MAGRRWSRPQTMTLFTVGPPPAPQEEAPRWGGGRPPRGDANARAVVPTVPPLPNPTQAQVEEGSEGRGRGQGKAAAGVVAESADSSLEMD